MGDGRLVYQEGAPVEPVRNGHRVILDGLNLAPSEVLEALNRLLDFVRWLYVPETQETISPHADFMLFATQNPASSYGGSTFLSCAFRDRFIEPGRKLTVAEKAGTTSRMSSQQTASALLWR